MELDFTAGDLREGWRWGQTQGAGRKMGLALCAILKAICAGVGFGSGTKTKSFLASEGRQDLVLLSKPTNTEL